MNHYSFTDMKVGMCACFDVEITESMQSAFMDMSGDINPMHVDKAYAIGGGV